MIETLSQLILNSPSTIVDLLLRNSLRMDPILFKRVISKQQHRMEEMKLSFHNEPVSDVLKYLDVDQTAGLSSAEVLARKTNTEKINSVKRKRKPPCSIFWISSRMS